MYSLPESTEVRKPLPKSHIFQKYEYTTAQRSLVDANIARLEFVNALIPATLPAVNEGSEVKGVFVIEAGLKRADFDVKAISLIAKSIPQRIVFVLRYDNKARLALYHDKLFITPWQSTELCVIPLRGPNLDAVWQNIVTFAGGMEIADGHSLSEQIRINDERAKILHRIESLERQMRASSQPRRQREIYAEIKALKGRL